MSPLATPTYHRASSTTHLPLQNGPEDSSKIKNNFGGCSGAAPRQKPVSPVKSGPMRELEKGSNVAAWSRQNRSGTVNQKSSPSVNVASMHRTAATFSPGSEPNRVVDPNWEPKQNGDDGDGMDQQTGTTSTDTSGPVAAESTHQLPKPKQSNGAL